MPEAEVGGHKQVRRHRWHLSAAGSGTSSPTNVSIATSTFTSNVATDRGGAVNLQAGYLTLTTSTFTNNR